MSKKAIIMLVFACVFATITAGLLVYDAFLSFSTYMILFGSHPESFGEALGDALGGVLLYAVTIILGVCILISSAATLPFDIILMKINGKKWYSIAILSFVATAVLAAIVFVAMLPVIAHIQDAVNASNSSSSAMSSENALLIY